MSQPADLSHFDDLHRDSDDPWGVRIRWYERRKRQLLLAALPREHYRSGFEPGCSVGGNTGALAERCDMLLATDASPAAIDRARSALAGRPGLQLEAWAFPQRWPDAPSDLVVVAELAYYLPPEDFQRFLREVAGHMQRGGHLLMCHWRTQVADAPTHGDAVHEAALRAFAQAGPDRPLQAVGHWQDEDMRIDVWQRGGPTSVAEAGGAQEKQKQRDTAV